MRRSPKARRHRRRWNFFILLCFSLAAAPAEQQPSYTILALGFPGFPVRGSVRRARRRCVELVCCVLLTAEEAGPGRAAPPLRPSRQQAL